MYDDGDDDDNDNCFVILLCFVDHDKPNDGS